MLSSTRHNFRVFALVCMMPVQTVLAIAPYEAASYSFTGTPVQLAVSEDRTIAALGLSGEIQVLSLPTLTLLETIDTPNTLRGVALSKNGSRVAYVVNTQATYLYDRDAQTTTVLREPYSAKPYSVTPDANCIAITPNAETVVASYTLTISTSVSIYPTYSSELVAYYPQTLTSRQLSKSKAVDVEFGADGTTVYAACGYQYTKSNAPSIPYFLCATTGSGIAVEDVLTGTGSFLTLPLPASWLSIAGDRAICYIKGCTPSTDAEIQLVDLVTGSVISEISLPGVAYTTFLQGGAYLAICKSGVISIYQDDALVRQHTYTVPSAMLDGTLQDLGSPAQLLFVAKSPSRVVLLADPDWGMLGEGEAEAPATRHTADLNQDGRIDLDELLRIVQLANSAGFRCADTGEISEDGYVAEVGPLLSCAPHDSDYLPQDWTINLDELLRSIQFYNSMGYYYCPEQETEDDFCPGPA